jgi:hypothetical protein
MPLPFAPASALDALTSTGYARLSPADLAGLAHQPLAALQALRPAWDDLPPDAHLKDGGRYRRRRHGSLVWDAQHGLQPVPHRAHWQPTSYNALHGGMLRWFEPLAPALAEAPGFLALIDGLAALFTQAVQARPAPPGEPAFDGHWFIEAHAFRIDTEGGLGRPTPEGAHRDGVTYVAVLLVDRQGIVGAETRVFEADGPQGVRFTHIDPWSALLLHDARVIHESTPIQPAVADTLGHRDTLVLTFRAQGFQDPPA